MRTARKSGRGSDSRNLRIGCLSPICPWWQIPGRNVQHFDSIPSTMQEALRFPPGTAVVAEEQTAGQGRHGHAWHSEPGAGIYCSLVLRPALTAEDMPALTLALGLATAEAIARATDLACDLRWPNDVMLSDKKAAGILVQLAGPTVVAGIGINVNHEAFPPELAQEATSLRIAGGRVYDRGVVLAALFGSVDGFVRMLEQAGRAAVLEQFARRSTWVSGKRVRVEHEGAAVTGVTAGLDDAGFLRVRADDGRAIRILSGGVRAAGS